MTTCQVLGSADILETAVLCTLVQIFILFLYTSDLLCTRAFVFTSKSREEEVCSNKNKTTGTPDYVPEKSEWLLTQ